MLAGARSDHHALASMEVIGFFVVVLNEVGTAARTRRLDGLNADGWMIAELILQVLEQVYDFGREVDHGAFLT